MRLTAAEVAAIKAAAGGAFESGTVVRLFGSRLNDRARGGDIDLHLEVNGEAEWMKAADFRWRLPRRMAERKIDLVFFVRGRPLRTIDQVALAEGVVL